MCIGKVAVAYALIRLMVAAKGQQLCRTVFLSRQFPKGKQEI